MKKLTCYITLMVLTFCQLAFTTEDPVFKKEAQGILRKQIMDEAAWAMQQKPITITAESSPRSAGGKHDFFSEADYFWPNPKSADSPYINKDG
jgi:hypothetical protein